MRLKRWGLMNTTRVLSLSSWPPFWTVIVVRLEQIGVVGVAAELALRAPGVLLHWSPGRRSSASCCRQTELMDS